MEAKRETKMSSTGYVTMTATVYATGKGLGEVQIHPFAWECYAKQTIGQWPEGIVAARDVMDSDEIERVGIEEGTTIFLED